MLAPESVHRYRCPCGEVVLEVAAPSWLAWGFPAERAMEHGPTCAQAAEKWTVEGAGNATPASL